MDRARPPIASCIGRVRRTLKTALRMIDEMARFVLVHGAFGGAWSWEPIVAPLEAAGHSVETLDLPGGGEDRTPVADVTLESCSERVCAQLRRSPEPALLVGYSMGGVVVTEAASSCPERVASLVFVAAFMPGNGQSLLDLAHLPEGKDDMIQANVVVAGDPPVATLPAEAAAEAIFNCCTPEQQAAAVPRLRPQPVAPFATPVQVDEALLASIPRSYVLTARDRSIPPALQRRMIAEHSCRRVIELDTDHSPMLSATDELAGALVELAAPAPAAAP
jgi:pimeloyl-ACP methyl ester carboxylesterase